MIIRVIVNGVDEKEVKIEAENGDPKAVAEALRAMLPDVTAIIRGQKPMEEGTTPVKDGEEVYASTSTKPNGR